MSILSALIPLRLPPQIERREIHVRRQVLIAGRAKIIFARAVTLVCEQRSAHVALVVQLRATWP